MSDLYTVAQIAACMHNERFTMLREVFTHDAEIDFGLLHRGPVHADAWIATAAPANAM